MCGIAGIVTADGQAPDPDLLDRMETALGHRGPDGSGRFITDGVGLVQTRLAIVDIAGGDQPLSGPDGRILMANGEIYNHVELREELGADAFRTGSDCEAILHVFRRADTAWPARLRGMFAFALFDPRDPEGPALWLGRDPFGIKPLYVIEGAFGLAFASEPQALIASGLIAPAVDECKCREMLELQFTVGETTPFAGIRRLAPGTLACVRRGRIAALSAPPAGGFVEQGALRQDSLEGDPVQALDRRFEESVRLHQRADVPYGMFLSGGIDSTAVLAMMARLNETPVLAYTAGFPGTGAADERAAASAAARAVGADHVDVPVTAADFFRVLPALARAMDDPVPDYACVPTFLLAARAARDVKVVLSGEGGDELFGGYGRYRAACRPWPFARPMRRHGRFEGLDVMREQGRVWRDDYAMLAARVTDADCLRRQQRIDMAAWLPNDLLIKLDRCLMAHGVEGRVPFLEPHLAGFALGLPDRLKVRGRTGKWLLRQWLAKAIPAARPFARKQGFTVPVGEWIESRAATLGPLVARQDCIRALCRPDSVAPLFEHAAVPRAGLAAWSLLFYACWHKCHIQGEKPSDDTVAFLSGA